MLVKFLTGGSTKTPSHHIHNTTRMSSPQELTPTPLAAYQRGTTRQACIVLRRHGIDFAFLDIRHVKLFALASNEVRKRLVKEWKFIIRATYAAAKQAYPDCVALDKQRVFQICEAKYLDNKALRIW